MCNKHMEILKEENIIFDFTRFAFDNNKYNNHQYDFKLLLVMDKIKGEYIVLSRAKYISDDSFSKLQPNDRINHSISSDLCKKFKTFEEAEDLFIKIFNNMPKNLSLDTLSNNIKICSFDDRKSIGNYDDKYNKDLFCYNYTKFFIRMFRREKEIIINRSLLLKFETQEDAIMAFQKIKDYFNSFETKTVFVEQNELNNMLDKLVSFAFKNTNNLILERSIDDFNRFNRLLLKFSYNNHWLNIRYNLPTRNAWCWRKTMDGLISFSGNGKDFCKSFTCENSFKNALNMIFDSLNIC